MTADLVLGDDSDLATPSVAAALAVLAGIAASDAACCARLGRRPRGQDHATATTLLRTVCRTARRWRRTSPGCSLRRTSRTTGWRSSTGPKPADWSGAPAASSTSLATRWTDSDLSSVDGAARSQHPYSIPTTLRHGMDPDRQQNAKEQVRPHVMGLGGSARTGDLEHPDLRRHQPDPTSGDRQTLAGLGIPGFRRSEVDEPGVPGSPLVHAACTVASRGDDAGARARGLEDPRLHGTR
jgi:hypothetical protein